MMNAEVFLCYISDEGYNYMYVLLSLLVAVPPATEKLTTTSEGREALEGMMFTIMGRII